LDAGITDLNANKAPLASPALTGTPTVPTAANGTNTDQAASTAFVANVYFYVGKIIEQLPDEPTPVEAGLPGTWEIWSNRAVLYGVRASMPSYTAYTSLVGTTIAGGSTPIAYLALNGDFGLFTFISQSSGYTVPATFDPVKWTRYSDGVTIYERQKCGNALTAADYAIGAKIASGTYADKYIVEKLVPGGKFFGIEGGFRPTFISGGGQGDRIRNFTGTLETRPNTNITAFLDLRVSGVYCPQNDVTRSYYSSAGLGIYPSRITLDPSCAVPAGPDNAPTNLSTRLWRRIS
jgi:hypothetical protein